MENCEHTCKTRKQRWDVTARATDAPLIPKLPDDVFYLISFQNHLSVEKVERVFEICKCLSR